MSEMEKRQAQEKEKQQDEFQDGKAAIPHGDKTESAEDAQKIKRSSKDKGIKPRRRAKGERRPVKIAVALGGGASKGLAHIGVLEVLEKEGIPVEIVTGTSAGSIVGALYAYGYTPKDIEDIAYEVGKWDFVDVTFTMSGIIKGERIASWLNAKVDNTKIEEFPRTFAAVATNFVSGETAVFKSGTPGELVRASCSIPSVFQPVEINGELYVDGGLTTPIPVTIARDLGADFVIGVDVSKRPDKELEQGMINNLLQTISIMNISLRQKELSKADIVLEPDVDEFGSFGGFDERSRTIEAGAVATKKAMPEILEELERVYRRINGMADDEPLEKEKSKERMDFSFKDKLNSGRRYFRAKVMRFREKLEGAAAEAEQKAKAEKEFLSGKYKGAGIGAMALDSTPNGEALADGLETGNAGKERNPLLDIAESSNTDLARKARIEMEKAKEKALEEQRRKAAEDAGGMVDKIAEALNLKDSAGKVIDALMMAAATAMDETGLSELWNKYSGITDGKDGSNDRAKAPGEAEILDHVGNPVKSMDGVEEIAKTTTETTRIKQTDGNETTHTSQTDVRISKDDDSISIEGQVKKMLEKSYEKSKDRKTSVRAFAKLDLSTEDGEIDSKTVESTAESDDTMEVHPESGPSPQDGEARDSQARQAKDEERKRFGLGGKKKEGKK